MFRVFESIFIRSAQLVWQQPGLVGENFVAKPILHNLFAVHGADIKVSPHQQTRTEPSEGLRQRTSAKAKRPLKRMDRLLYSVEVLFFFVTKTTLCILVLARNLSKSDSVAIRSMNFPVKPAVAASAMAFAERCPAPNPDYVRYHPCVWEGPSSGPFPQQSRL